MGDQKLPGMKLPRLCMAVDCAPIDYPGLKVWFWLNVTYDPDRVTNEEYRALQKKHLEETSEKMPDRPAWEGDYYYSLGRIVDRVELPGEYTEDGVDAEIEIRSGKNLHDLMTTRGFEQDIILWASTRYYDLKQERLKAEIKN